MRLSSRLVCYDPCWRNRWERQGKEAREVAKALFGDQRASKLKRRSLKGESEDG